MRMSAMGFLELLERIKHETGRGQSFEGRLHYEALDGGAFEVDAFIRTNNHLGQGSALVISPSDEETQ